MQKRRKLAQLLLFLIILTALLSVIPASAKEADSNGTPSLEEASTVLLSRLKTGSITLSKNATQRISAGSTPKIMTGLLACERLADRKNESVTITSQMLAQVGGANFKLRAGEVYTVEQLLYIALCGSYNDACDVLACYISGSVDGFAEEMNRRAAALGVIDTFFSDASGIDDGSYTTAEDLAKIAEAAYRNPLYMSITSATRFSFVRPQSDEDKTVYNRNALISSASTSQYFNKRCRGMNAGSTNRAGNCVVTVATDGTDDYLCIVMGGAELESKNYAYVVANRLINWVYEAFSYLEIISPETPIGSIPVTVSDFTSEVAFRTDRTLSLYLPKATDLKSEITYSIRLLYDSLEAPVSEGVMVGYVAILYKGETLDTLPLYTVESAERSGFISSLKSIQALTQSRVFRAGAIFFIVVLLGWIITEYIIIKRRRHKWDKYFSMKIEPSPAGSDPTRKHKKRTLR